LLTPLRAHTEPALHRRLGVRPGGASRASRDGCLVAPARLGDRTLLGRTCEHWKHDGLNYDGCRWNNIELEFLNGAGTSRIVQRTVAVELVEGEGIPDRFKAIVP
jgi:hypothetical protein